MFTHAYVGHPYGQRFYLPMTVEWWNALISRMASWDPRWFASFGHDANAIVKVAEMMKSSIWHWHAYKMPTLDCLELPWAINLSMHFSVSIIWVKTILKSHFSLICPFVGYNRWILPHSCCVGEPFVNIDTISSSIRLFVRGLSLLSLCLRLLFSLTKC